MAKWNFPWVGLGLMLYPIYGMAWGQTVPDAPEIPTCTWDGGGTRSTCKFKDALTGTPTSVVGNRVILFNRSANGGNGDSRRFIASALGRLSARYGFIGTITEDPTIFTAANLANAKVVIMSNGDGDVVPPGANRKALEDFQQVNGWGVVWIHAACSFISSGWPFGQQSCVEQYFHHNPSGTSRRMFIDSGTSAQPNHGRKNPQSEFLLRQLPGWGNNLTFQMAEEWYCFRAPARNTPGVNVLLGYDRGSGLPPDGCPDPGDTSEAASQAHNLAWTHSMGKGITLVNSIGQNEGAYTSAGNMGDSLLWRYIRYAAKDWCVGGSGEPGCDAPSAVRTSGIIPEAQYLRNDGVLVLSIPGAERSEVTLGDLGGKRVFSEFQSGSGPLEVKGLKRGLYLLRIHGKRDSRSQRIRVF